MGLLLAANLAGALPSWMEGGEPEGWLTPDILRRVGLWVPVAMLGLCGLLGLFWTTQALSRGGRSGTAWARWGFGFSLIAGMGLVVAVFEQETFPRENLVVLFLVVYALQMLLFVCMARLQASGSGSRGGSRKMRRPTPLAPPPEGTPAGNEPESVSP